MNALNIKLSQTSVISCGRVKVSGAVVIFLLSFQAQTIKLVATFVFPSGIEIAFGIEVSEAERLKVNERTLSVSSIFFANA